MLNAYVVIHAGTDDGLRGGHRLVVSQFKFEGILGAKSRSVFSLPNLAMGRYTRRVRAGAFHVIEQTISKSIVHQCRFGSGVPVVSSTG
jgi:hypothetical protein